MTWHLATVFIGKIATIFWRGNAVDILPIKGYSISSKDWYGTSDSRKAWFAVGDYKRLENVVGDMETCPVKKVHAEISKLLARYNASRKTFEDVLDFHVGFEGIHPFQDGNGRIGRLILLKECLKNGHVPFVIAENLRQFYYLGLDDWRHGRHARLLDTCRTGQDIFALGLRQFGHARVAAAVEKTIGAST